MSDALCKGDWALGTACGKCARCRDGMPGELVRLDRELRELSAAVGRLKTEITASSPTVVSDPRITITIDAGHILGRNQNPADGG